MSDKSEKTEQQKDNYKRLILAVALYYSNILGIDTLLVDDYSKLTDSQKMFAKKVVEQNPKIEKQLARKSRLSEQTITKDIAKIATEEQKSEDNGNSGDLKKIITAGDQNVCEHCKKWQNKIISLSGNDRRYPSLDDAIEDGFLHMGCKCYLADIQIDEIPLKSDLNPRYAGRKQARPDLYNSAKTPGVVFSGQYFRLYR